MDALPTKSLKPIADHLAPDGSEIRLLVDMPGGGLCHCTLPAGGVSRPVAHRGVEEMWYCIEGEGEVWRHRSDESLVTAVVPGTSLGIPPQTAFQFRNTGATPLRLLIATMPPWPGPNEAQPASGRW